MNADVAISRSDLDAAGLRRAAARSRDADAARRMFALDLIMDGHTRTEAAQLCVMDRQTLRDWVHRYNDLGRAGLSDRVEPGPSFRPSRRPRWRQVREGPMFAEHGVVRWHRIDLSRAIESSPRRRTKKLADLVAASIPEHARGKRLELWWQDEARIG